MGCSCSRRGVSEWLAGKEEAGSCLVAVGDEFTSLPQMPASARWTGVCLAVLAAHGAASEAPSAVVECAKTGWAAADVLLAFKDQFGEGGEGLASVGKHRGGVSCCTVCVGAHDVRRGTSAVEFRRAVRELLHVVVRSMLGGRGRSLVVLSVPDESAAPWGLAEVEGSVDPSWREGAGARVDGYNALLRSAVEEVHGQMVDVTAITRAVEAYPKLLYAEGTGALPSELQAVTWADAVSPSLARAVGAPHVAESIARRRDLVSQRSLSALHQSGLVRTGGSSDSEDSDSDGDGDGEAKGEDGGDGTSGAGGAGGDSFVDLSQIDISEGIVEFFGGEITPELAYVLGPDALSSTELETRECTGCQSAHTTLPDVGTGEHFCASCWREFALWTLDYEAGRIPATGSDGDGVDGDGDGDGNGGDGDGDGEQGVTVDRLDSDDGDADAEDDDDDAVDSDDGVDGLEDEGEAAVASYALSSQSPEERMALQLRVLEAPTLGHGPCDECGRRVECLLDPEGMTQFCERCWQTFMEPIGDDDDGDGAADVEDVDVEGL